MYPFLNRSAKANLFKKKKPRKEKRTDAFASGFSSGGEPSKVGNELQGRAAVYPKAFYFL
jgi:hypothetical protein